MERYRKRERLRRKGSENKEGKKSWREKESIQIINSYKVGVL